MQSLLSNVQAYELDGKVTLQNGDFVQWVEGEGEGTSSRKEWVDTEAPLALIIDPPWGGAEYQKKEVINELYLYSQNGMSFKEALSNV